MKSYIPKINNLKLLAQFKFGDLHKISVSENYWVLNSLSGRLNGYEVKRLQKYSNGLSFRLNQLANYFGYPQEYSITKGDVVLDIGANIGEFSIFALQKGAKVLSVEPDTKINPCTKKNVGGHKNSLGVAEFAISHKNGKIQFYQSPSSADSSIIQPSNYERVINVNTLTLNDLYEKFNLKKVDLIKCDAEGAEPEVLAVADKALALTKKVAFNCGPERKGQETVDEVSEILKRNNFNVKVIDGYRPKTIVIGHNNKFI